MESIIDRVEQKNKRKGQIISVIVHALLLILAFLPFLQYPDPPPGQEGILISFGQPEAGVNDDPASGPIEVTEVQEAIEEAVEVERQIEEAKQKAVEAEPEPVEEEPVVEEEEVVTDNTSEELAIQKEEERKRKEAEDAKRAEEERLKKEAEEAEKKRKEDEARKKADADKLKEDIFGGLNKNKDKGKGQGDGGNPGNQGDPNGGNSDLLEGVSTGAGRVGRGLGDRGGSGPPVESNINSYGRVLIEVCVDDGGRVIKAEYTQKSQVDNIASTSNDANLIALAKKNAMKWTFNSGTLDKQCGVIIYNFKAK